MRLNIISTYPLKILFLVFVITIAVNCQNKYYNTLEQSKIEISIDGRNKLFLYPVINLHSTPYYSIGIISINNEWLLLDHLSVQIGNHTIIKNMINYDKLINNDARIETAIFEFTKDEFEKISNSNYLVLKLSGEKKEYEFTLLKDSLRKFKN